MAAASFLGEKVLINVLNKFLARHLTAYLRFLKAVGDVTEFVAVDFKPTAKIIDIVSLANA